MKLWRYGLGAWATGWEMRYWSGSHQQGSSRCIHDYGKHTFENLTSLFISIAVFLMLIPNVLCLDYPVQNSIDKSYCYLLLQNVKWFLDSLGSYCIGYPFKIPCRLSYSINHFHWLSLHTQIGREFCIRNHTDIHQPHELHMWFLPSNNIDHFLSCLLFWANKSNMLCNLRYNRWDSKIVSIYDNAWKPQSCIVLHEDIYINVFMTWESLYLVKNSNITVKVYFSRHLHCLKYSGTEPQD